MSGHAWLALAKEDAQNNDAARSALHARAAPRALFSSARRHQQQAPQKRLPAHNASVWGRHRALSTVRALKDPATEGCMRDDWVCGHCTERRPCPPRECSAPAGSMSSGPLTAAARAKSWRHNYDKTLPSSAGAIAQEHLVNLTLGVLHAQQPASRTMLQKLLCMGYLGSPDNPPMLQPTCSPDVMVQRNSCRPAASISMVSSRAVCCASSMVIGSQHLETSDP